MALRKIRYEQDDILRKKSKPVREITPKIIALLTDMEETMRSLDGVGLAAPQVGILKRIVVVDAGDGLLELINPEIIESEGGQTRREGCLSIPGVAGIVERPAYVKVKGLNRDGEEIIVEGTELKAVVLSHEIDHLDGILYVDKVIQFIEDDDEDVEDEEEV